MDYQHFLGQDNGNKIDTIMNVIVSFRKIKAVLLQCLTSQKLASDLGCTLLYLFFETKHTDEAGFSHLDEEVGRRYTGFRS